MIDRDTPEIHAPLDAALGALRSARAMADNMGDEAGAFLSSRAASLAGELEALIAEVPVPRQTLAEQNAALRAENADLNDELERWQRWWHDDVGGPAPDPRRSDTDGGSLT